MHQSMAFVRKKTLNTTGMLLLLSLWAVLQVTYCEKNITWFDSEITITRNLNSLDFFDFWTSKDTKGCSLNILTKVCENYGGFETERTNCKVRCVCGARSTFIAQRQQCVPDMNITRLPDNNQFLLDSPNSLSTPCTNNSALPTLDLTKPGNTTFTMCLNGVTTPPEMVHSCRLIPNKHSTVDSWKGSEDLQKYVQNNFEVKDKMMLKWNGIIMQSIQGFVLSVSVKCKKKFFTPHAGLTDINVESPLYFKVEGSQTVKGPQVFYRIVEIPTLSPTTQYTTIPTTTASTTNNYNSKLNVVHVPGKADLLLVIVSAALGSVLFLVIMIGVVLIVVFRRKQKLNISGKHTSNPTYERGPDQSFAPNGLNTGSFKYHIYQPLVENTRDAPHKEPIYESLDDNLRGSKMSLTENPTHRCSLAYCDVTSDGYLIPTDGPIPASFPSNTGTTPPPNATTRPRLSSSYDEPEVILKDRKPKLTVEIPAEDNTKPDYHELEDEQKERPQDNETIVDNSKSPSENTYLELIAEEPNHSRDPLESDTL